MKKTADSVDLCLLGPVSARCSFEKPAKIRYDCTRFQCQLAPATKDGHAHLNIVYRNSSLACSAGFE